MARLLGIVRLTYLKFELIVRGGGGLRVGELCGLTVVDVDLDRGIMQVRHSAWRGKLGDPKTEESTRVVELSPRACENLRLHFDRWHPNERRLVFASKNGTPWDQNMILKRRLRPLLKSLGITVPRGNGFHAFRHANATKAGVLFAKTPARRENRRVLALTPNELAAFVRFIHPSASHWLAS